MSICNAVPTLPRMSNKVAWESPMPLGCQNEMACEASHADSGNRYAATVMSALTKLTSEKSALVELPFAQSEIGQSY